GAVVRRRLPARPGAGALAAAGPAAAGRHAGAARRRPEEKPPQPGTPEAKLAGARELFRRGDYAKAADLFHSLTDKSHLPEAVVLEATFYEAECQRVQGRYARAADVYVKLLKLSPSNPYREQAVQHLFDIANYWL